MLGRKQNIYLILSLVLVIVSIFFDLATLAGSATIDLSLIGASSANVESFEGAPVLFHYIPVIFLIGSIIMLIVALFFHSKVEKQRKLIYGAFACLLVLIGAVFMGVKDLIVHFGKTEDDVQYGIGMFLPVAALALVIMSLRAVRKDVELLRSIDRIR